MEPYKDIKDKVALITGGSRGIGKAIALELALRGYKTIFTYNKNLQLAKEVKKTITSKGLQAEYFKLDQSKRRNVRDLINKIIKTFNSIDILVNNAAISQEKPFEDISDKDWEYMMKVNLQGPFMLIQEVLPIMIKKNWGRIINIVSIGGQWGGFNQVHYAASKAALINLTHSIAKLYSKYNITSNAVSPGLVLTDMSKREISSKQGKEKIKNIPLNRIAKPEEVAKVVAFLASEDASYITGQTINVNGGMLLSHGV